MNKSGSVSESGSDAALFDPDSDTDRATMIYSKQGNLFWRFWMLRFYRGLSALLFFFWLLAPILAVAQVPWVKNFDDALKQAAKEKKFVVLDISASW